MDTSPISFKEENQLMNSYLWQLALQDNLPLTAADSLPLTATDLSTTYPAPEFLPNHQQYLATGIFQQPSNNLYNGSLFQQYPTAPGAGQVQPYPNLDPLTIPEDAILPFDQPPCSDSTYNDSPILAESSTNTSSPLQFSECSSPELSLITERSPTPERSTRRRRRKSSSSSKGSKSSSSTKSRSSLSNIQRVRERNRISAQRFRDKKKADAIDLELRTHKLSEQRDQLMAEITDLQWQSIELQAQCLRQVMCGCDDMRSFFKNKTNLHEKLCQTELQCHTAD